MIARLVSRNGQGKRQESDFPCTHLVKTFYDDSTEVELCPDGPVLVLPRDGEVIYQMNDFGATVGKILPPRPRQAGGAGASTGPSTGSMP